MLLSASARSPGLLKNYSVALTSSRAKLLVGQKPWAKAIGRVEMLNVVVSHVVGQLQRRQLGELRVAPLTYKELQ